MFGKKNLSLQLTTDSDAVFGRECIGEGFKITTVAVFELWPFFDLYLINSAALLEKKSLLSTEFFLQDNFFQKQSWGEKWYIKRVPAPEYNIWLS